jgi:hypothetical protein
VGEYDTHECDYDTIESDLYTQGTISHAECNFYMHCEFNRHERDYITHECDLNMHKIAFYTQSTISTRRVWFYTQNRDFTHTSPILTHMRVNMTLTSVITTRSIVIYTRKVQFHT